MKHKLFKIKAPAVPGLEISGFTLIESIVTVAIIAAVTAVALPFLSTFQPNQQLDYIVQDMVEALRTAQNRSAGSLGGDQFGVKFSSSTFEVFQGSVYPGELILTTEEIPASLEIYQIELANSSDMVMFEKNTGQTDNFGVIKVRVKDRSDEMRTIIITRLGLVRYVDGDYSLGNQPPESFSLLSPSNGSSVAGTTPTFDWQDSTDPEGSAVTYTIYVDNNSDFSSPEIENSGLASSTYTAAPGDGLSIDTWYWKVSATDGTATTWSSQTVWEFTIGGNAPSAFNLLAPSNGATVSSTTPLLDWEDSADADPGDTVTYTVYVDNNSDFSSPEIENSGLSASQYQVLGADNLSDESTYYWKVLATDGVNIVWSNQTDWSFSISIPEPPGAFNLLAPSNGASVSTLTPTLDWEDSIDPEPGDTVTYTIYVDNNSDFSSPEIQNSGLTSSTYSVVGADNLSDNSTYYWKAEATDGTYTTTSSQTWSFTTNVPEPPGAFNLLAPANGSTQATSTPAFDWEDSIDPDPGDTVTYTIYIDNNSDFSSPEATHSGITSSQYQSVPADNLQDGVTYYWRIFATDGTYSVGSVQTNWSFSIDINESPGAFNLLSPGNGDTVYTPTPSFDWEDSVDPDPGDTVTYTIYIDNNSDFSSPEIQTGAIAASNYTAAASLSSGTWYWKVEATDGINTTPSAQTNWSFTISLDQWFVDQSVAASGDGRSWATAFKTIGEAVSALSSGDTVNIANGTYSEDISLGSGQSGVIGNLTEFVNKSGDTGVIIDGSGTVVNFTNADYIRLSGLKLANAQYGISLSNDSDNNEIINLEIYGHTRTGIEISHSTVDSLIVRQSTIRNNTEYGVYLRGTGHRIYDSAEIHGNGDGGVYSNSATNVQIYDSAIYGNNVVGLYFNRAVDTTLHHLQIYGHTTYGQYFNRPSNFNVYNCTIHDNGTYGYYIERPSTFKSRNHIITSNANGFHVNKGNSTLDNDYNDVWNNTNNYSGQGSSYSGANSISSDPLYVNAAANDFNLQSGSPCINAGDPNPTYNDPNGSRADMGALPTLTP